MPCLGEIPIDQVVEREEVASFITAQKTVAVF